MLLGEITKTGASAAAGLLVGIGLVFVIQPGTYEGVAVLLIIAILTVTVVTGLVRLAWRGLAPPAPTPHAGKSAAPGPRSPPSKPKSGGPGRPTKRRVKGAR